MAKSLGMIHTVNTEHTFDTSGQVSHIDLPGELTQQLSRMIRAGNFFKLVGIDMSMDAQGTVGGGQISGYLRYYAPTRGRCAAFREAFAAMKNVMKMQGINTWTNPLYDFRAPLNDDTSVSGDFPNQATLDGDRGLSLNDSQTDSSIFGVFNESVRPQYTSTADNQFGTGFKTVLADLQTTPTDFVRNDEVMWSGNSDKAATEYEKIPFMITYTPDSVDTVWSVQWRPDPALYVAILCGQLQIVAEEVNRDSDAPALNLQVACHVSGWKSIMGNPDKKRRRKSRRKKMSSNAKTIADLKKIVGVK